MNLKKLVMTCSILAIATAAWAAPRVVETYEKIGALAPASAVVKTLGKIAPATNPVVINDLVVQVFAPQDQKNSDLLVYLAAKADADLSKTEPQLLALIGTEWLKDAKDDASFAKSKRVKQLRTWAAGKGKAVKDLPECFQNGETFYQLLPVRKFDEKGKETNYGVAMWVGSTSFINVEYLLAQQQAAAEKAVKK